MPTVHQLARQICERLGWPDHRTLAKELAAAADQIDNPETALLPFAYSYLRNPRSWPAPAAPRSNGSPAPSGGPGAGQLNSSRSSRVALVRATWPVLRLDYAVSATERRPLLDCNAADLEYAAANLAQASTRTRDRARLLAQLRGELSAHHAVFVRDLPDDVLEVYAGRFGYTRGYKSAEGTAS